MSLPRASSGARGCGPRWPYQYLTFTTECVTVNRRPVTVAGIPLICPACLLRTCQECCDSRLAQVVPGRELRAELGVHGAIGFDELRIGCRMASSSRSLKE